MIDRTPLPNGFVAILNNSKAAEVALGEMGKFAESTKSTGAVYSLVHRVLDSRDIETVRNRMVALMGVEKSKEFYSRFPIKQGQWYVIDTDQIRHTLNGHGVRSEDGRRGIAITATEISQLAQIMRPKNIVEFNQDPGHELAATFSLPGKENLVAVQAALSPNRARYRTMFYTHK